VRKPRFWRAIEHFGIMGFCLLLSNPIFAQVFGDGFENKMQNVTNKLITVIMPILSVLGIVYAVFLALTGDGGAKGRIIMVVVCSIIGFLSPYLVSWLQAITGN